MQASSGDCLALEKGSNRAPCGLGGARLAVAEYVFLASFRFLVTGRFLPDACLPVSDMGAQKYSIVPFLSQALATVFSVALTARHFWIRPTNQHHFVLRLKAVINHAALRFGCASDAGDCKIRPEWFRIAAGVHDR